MSATVRIELIDKDGTLLEVRQAHNAVMRSGAQLIANLFSGKGKGITHMGVGTSDAIESEAYDTVKLSNLAVGDLAPLAGDIEAPIPPDSFSAPVIDDTKRVVRVKLRGTLPAPAAVGTIREAGLISKDDAGEVLYNRVTFAPITKGNDHELTMFWEVSFPYGDLQWLL